MTTTDVELHGQAIPAGERVVLIWASANRDERRWQDSERLDFSREPKRHLAFGEGITIVSGHPHAAGGHRIFLEALLSRSPDFEVGSPERHQQVVVRGIARLPVVFGGARARAA